MSAIASVTEEVATRARPEEAWAAIADIGAPHTRLVPGFVVATRLEPGARVVTFANGAVVRDQSGAGRCTTAGVACRPAAVECRRSGNRGAVIAAEVLYRRRGTRREQLETSP